jgi:hypothetical protein
MSEQYRNDDSLLASLSRARCPDCGYRGVCIGPMAVGVVTAVNVECGNLNCRHRFNVSYYAGQAQFAHRLESAAEGGVLWPSEPQPGETNCHAEPRPEAMN